MSDAHLHLYPHRKGDPLPPPPPDRYSLAHIEQYVEMASRRGVSELTFTEHLYRCVESTGALGNIWAVSYTHIRAHDTILTIA